MRSIRLISELHSTYSAIVFVVLRTCFSTQSWSHVCCCVVTVLFPCVSCGWLLVVTRVRMRNEDEKVEWEQGKMNPDVTLPLLSPVRHVVNPLLPLCCLFYIAFLCKRKAGKGSCFAPFFVLLLTRPNVSPIIYAVKGNAWALPLREEKNLNVLDIDRRVCVLAQQDARQCCIDSRMAWMHRVFP
jgi:hypothetical protein